MVVMRAYPFFFGFRTIISRARSLLAVCAITVEVKLVLPAPVVRMAFTLVSPPYNPPSFNCGWKHEKGQS